MNTYNIVYSLVHDIVREYKLNEPKEIVNNDKEIRLIMNHNPYIALVYNKPTYYTSVVYETGYRRRGKEHEVGITTEFKLSSRENMAVKNYIRKIVNSNTYRIA